VAREAAALVITDDDYTSIAGGIRQGRGIFANLRKAMAYIVAVHVPIVGMSLIPVFVADWPLVLVPVLIAFLELIIDPACSIVFEAEQVDPGVMQEPPRRIGEPIFAGRVLLLAALQGLSVLAAVLGLYLWAVLTGRPDGEVRSITFATLVIGNPALILVNRSWRLPIWSTFRQRRNRALPWILLGALALLAALLGVPWLRTAFGLGTISVGEAAAAFVAGLAGVAWFEVYKIVGRRTR
jgi:Ca2+-transporting ATPase